MTALGVRLDPIPQISLGDSVGLAQLAETLGYGMVWVPEGGGVDSPTRLAAYAMATDRVRLGTGILPVFSRTPTLTAMTAAGLDLISGHRFTLGLGVGHQGSVEGTRGVKFRRPVTRIKETVAVVKELLAGGASSHRGRLFGLDNASLGFGASFPVPVYVAALGPRMVELAGEVADGVLLNWAAPSYLNHAMERLHDGAKRAGRNPDDIDVACYIRVAVTDDEEAVRTPLKRQILRYCGMDYYRDFFAKTGFAAEAEAIGRYLAEGDGDKALDAVSDPMQRQLAVFGPADYCRAEVERRRALGVKQPVIAPFTVGDALPQYRATIRGMAPQAEG